MIWYAFYGTVKESHILFYRNRNRSITGIKAGFSKDYDQYNYFYYDNYFSSMESRVLATFADRNMLSLIFLVCVKYFLGIN